MAELVVHLNCNCVMMGSNLGLDKITFFFVKTYFGMEVRRRKNPRRQLEKAENHVLIVNQ